jgi:hypothetical protein
MGLEHVNWIQLCQGRDWWWAVLNLVMKLRVPWKADNLTSWVLFIIFSSTTLLHRSNYLVNVYDTLMNINYARAYLLCFNMGIFFSIL